MATGNFYNDVNGIFAFAMDAVDELDYELALDNVLYTLTSTLKEQGHNVTTYGQNRTNIEVDGLVKMRIEDGYYVGAQIIIENLERAVVAEEEGLDLDEDHYNKVYAYEIEDGSDIAYTDNLADVVEAGEDVYEMYSDCLWTGYSEDEPTELPRVVVSSINHPDYTQLDYAVINALTKATTAYKVAWQASNGETAYEKMEG